MLPFINEKDAGLKPGTCDEFISGIVENRINLHSVMLIKNNCVLCEQYAPGFDIDFKHRLYSVSKTYVSAAVGVAIEEGYFSLETKIADYFTDKLPENPHPYLQNLTVRDCLIMATPFDETPYHHTHYDWVKDFFTASPTHRGGTLFHYDTGATLVLDELVKRATGKPFTNYLYEKVLQYIGYTQVPRCVETPDGTLWGGSGIFATTREFAAFALLWMNGGKNKEGKQLLPAWYVREATDKQIGNQENNQQNAYKGYGYGYQIWRHKYGWAMFGMGNQLALCFPEQNIMFICTGDDQGNDFGRVRLFELLEDTVLKQLDTFPTANKYSGLIMPQPMGDSHSHLSEQFNGKKYKINHNSKHLEEIVFSFSDDICRMDFTKNGIKKTLLFGIGKFVAGVFPENGYSANRINTPLGHGYRCVAAANWDLPDLLVLKCYATDDYFGVLNIHVRFSQNGIDILMTKKAEWFFEEYEGFFTGTAE